MKPNDLKAVFKTRAGIAEVFAPVNEGKPLTRSAMCQWWVKKRVPELREYQLRALVPDIDQRIAEAKKPKQRRAA